MLSEIHFMKKSRKRMPSSDKTSTALSPIDGLTVDIRKKRHLVRVDETVFVEEIKKRSIIYESALVRSGNNALRNEAWSEVAQIMNLSVQECKKRWRSMRDGFLKQIRQKSEEDRKSWIHYRLLEFLLPSIGGFIPKQHANVYGQGEDESDSIDYLEADSDVELDEDAPITVSYVTEDGKELFQVLHTSSMPPLPDTALINVDKFSNAGQEAGQIVETMLGNKFLTHDGIAKLVTENTGQTHRQNTNQYDYSESYEGDFVATREEEQEEGDSLNTHVYEERIESTEILEQENQDQMRISETDNESFTDEHYLSTPHHVSDLDDEGYVCVSERRKSCAQLEPEEERLDHNVLPGYRIEEQLPAASLPGAPESSLLSIAPGSSIQREITKETDARLGITDPDERFLMSCAPILRRLPNKKNLLARLKIQQMLYELEYEEKYNYDGSS